ncbi:MAG: CusA/CzcA family heavy metal efflux RND transporter [Nitrospina sp.]|jgi:heavy metal efflux system protein|nr:CusA/CzcA family heavy metal efflux RND transporter [Nitrospina sp.]MBT3509219.1 CusA/CzcA family heavy metal efflux RND transporter [Nitrospina sp.]MBT3877170.1 CusA/CzcA family heavy metal efflux RND transporter [Nitrospina sp.]MBT4048111.1 CusA/CzcA family heavy metal efflux RND transporter [Nitrospina sp.]MBT4559183.1 CusA/CzcA family heavy metal efflux RND transporter [Nitrospina sp.]
MLKKIIAFSIQQRFFVIVGALALIALGSYNFSVLPIDAVPDVTNIQVQINTEAPGFTPLEVEQRITFPIETTLSGIPRLKRTRSISRYGLSQVTVIFEDGTDIYFARQLINSKLQEVKSNLPENVEPAMGPIATGLGEIFMWSVAAEAGYRKPDGSSYSSIELRTIQDWIIKPQLMNIPGVTEVNSLGGYVKNFQVSPDPQQLIAYDFSFRDVIAALSRNNQNKGAGYIERSGQQYLVRTPGQVSGVEDIKNIVIGSHKGVPIYIKDVASVGLGKELRTGAATKDGEEVVLGTVFMLKGENSRTVSLRVAEKMKSINLTLPEGVQAQTVYDRTHLVNATLQTIRDNLLEGALLVIAILFLLLGNFRAAVITALVIPLSMLFAVTGMVSNRVSGNLLSLGAIDFGIIVDGAVIIVENCCRRLAEEQKRMGRILHQQERFEIVQNSACEVSRPSIFGVFIIMIVYLPILTLTGIEGKMFQPMAFTVLTALAGALILSITFVPAMMAQFASSSFIEKESGFLKNGVYSFLLDFTSKNRASVITFAGVLVLLSVLLSQKMGSEFLPTLDERDFAVHALRVPGTSLSQAVSMQDTLEKKIKELPEVDYVFAKIGTADIATDPMPPSVADVFVMVKPRDQWKDPNREKAELVEDLEKKLAEVSGNKYEITQPIEMRFNELISGVRSDVAVKVFGDDLDKLLELADEIEHVLADIPGASDVKVEQVTGLPVLTVEMDRPAMARLGINAVDVQEVVEIAVGGKKSGQVFEGDRRFDLIVRLSEDIRTNIDLLKEIPIPLIQDGEDKSHSSFSKFIPLGTIVEFKVIKGPNQISRENGKRRVVVTANVRGRDLGSFVEEAQNALREINEPGYWVEWGGQFEHLISASQRLWVVIPLTLILIYLLLFAAFGSNKNALLVFTGVPLALTGGFLSLWLRGIPLSISAAVGFIALSGVAVLNGMVMITFIGNLRDQGVPLDEAIRQGSLTRLRPVLMTALVASLGFIPMALATGTGAEVQRPLATVVIGGIISSTALTLVVLPALYHWFHTPSRGRE